MAPEVLFDGRNSFKADIYSLGVLIVELLTGQRDYQDSVGQVRTFLTTSGSKCFAINLLDVHRLLIE
jgi:serine/threonine protein kinase